MINLTQSANYLHQLESETGRNPKYKKADIAAVHALTQAAVNVELFTIPLYMTSMYSIQGLHQINEGNNFYQGRRWPGAGTSVDPKNPGVTHRAGDTVDTNNEFNRKSFNTIFSVFIQEMLHLQLAANICTALNKDYDGKKNSFNPTFTSPLLQGTYSSSEDDKQYPHAWLCYGPEKTVIPHIIDLTDLKNERVFGDSCLALDEIKVKLGALDKNSISLFMAIEAPESVVKKYLKPGAESKYFPNAPFSDEIWNEHSEEKDLPMFGSIAHMYTCLAKYLNVEYSDGETLFSAVFNTDSAQQDLFNFSNRKGGKGKSGHPCSEFPAMGDLTVTAAEPTTAKKQIFNMISGITDQGEGGPLDVEPTDVANAGLQLAAAAPVLDELSGEVETRYQPDRLALEADYPSYNDKGERLPLSADAQARSVGGEIDHFTRFMEVAEYVAKDQITTWEQWHQDNNNCWTKELLTTVDYDSASAPKNIPCPGSVATALNNLKSKDFDADGSSQEQEFSEKNFKLFSHVAAGSIAGITTVLNEFWCYENFINDPIDFPYPSMSGSGDRISICWAIFGKAPDLSLGAFERKSGVWHEGLKAPVNHACQGLGFNADGTQDTENVCATKGVFHTCKGSNQCGGEGGCGYVHDALKGGGGCGGSSSGTSQGFVSAPAGNKCGSLGGCAVPISDSQLLPESGTMQLFKLNERTKDGYEPLGTMKYDKGDGVYDTAWRAYQSMLNGKVLNKDDVKEQAPAASDLRLAFPPST